MITTLGKDAVIEDVGISGVSAHGEQGIVINAVPDSTVRNIRLSNVQLQVGAGPMSPFSGGTLDIRPHSMERRQLPVLFARGIDGLSLRDVDLTIDECARELFPDPLELSGCRGTEISGLRDRSGG